MLFTTFISSALSQPHGIVVLACFVSRYLAVDSVGTTVSNVSPFFVVSLSLQNKP